MTFNLHNFSHFWITWTVLCFQCTISYHLLEHNVLNSTSQSDDCCHWIRSDPCQVVSHYSFGIWFVVLFSVWFCLFEFCVSSRVRYLFAIPMWSGLIVIVESWVENRNTHNSYERIQRPMAKWFHWKFGSQTTYKHMMTIASSSTHFLSFRFIFFFFFIPLSSRWKNVVIVVVVVVVVVEFRYNILDRFSLLSD